jgi:mono/diheme cytochrome c family protein
MSHMNEGQDRLDYRETADITEVHASVVREHAEPRAGSMPIPTWLGVLCAGALCWAGIYVGMFHGGFSSKVYNEYDSSPVAFFGLKQKKDGAAGAAADVPLAVLGEKVYGANCASCHLPNGVGTAAVPPLAGSEWVDGAEFGDKRLVAILMKGIKGPINVKGTVYNGVMPNLGQSMKPRDVAAVLTFIRQAWGNKGTGEITEAQVVAAKKDALIADKVGEWTEAELKQIPAGVTLGGAEATVTATPAGSGSDATAGGPGAAAGTPAPAAPATAGTPAPAATPAGGTPAPAPAASTFDLAGSVNRGKPLYMQTCMACHQATGQGIPGAFPPLAGVDYVTGDPKRLIAIVVKGITGPMTVKGNTYVAGMISPVLTFPQLKDDKNLADVLNHVRNSFGNTSAVAITPEMVAEVRQALGADATTPFTEETLKNFK